MKYPFNSILILFIILVSMACRNDSSQHIIEPDELGAILESYDGGIHPKEIKGLLESDNHMLIDIRDVTYFRKGHLPGAINIPVGEFNNVNVLRDLGDYDGTLVLYGEDEAQTIGPYCILNYKGYDNVQTAMAGYQVIQSDSLAYSFPENRQKYDYATEYEKALSNLKAKKKAEKPDPVVRYISPDPSPEKKKIQIKPKKRRPAVQEEGC